MLPYYAKPVHVVIVCKAPTCCHMFQSPYMLPYFSAPCVSFDLSSLVISGRTQEQLYHSISIL